jgi:hypothetical protein
LNWPRPKAKGRGVARAFLRLKIPTKLEQASLRAERKEVRRVESLKIVAKEGGKGQEGSPPALGQIAGHDGKPDEIYSVAVIGR